MAINRNHLAITLLLNAAWCIGCLLIMIATHYPWWMNVTVLAGAVAIGFWSGLRWPIKRSN